MQQRQRVRRHRQARIKRRAIVHLRDIGRVSDELMLGTLKIRDREGKICNQILSDQMIQLSGPKVSATESIRTAFKRRLRRRPEFGISSPDTWELMHCKLRSFLQVRELFRELPREFRGDYQLAKLTSQALVGIQLYCREIPLEIAQLCYLHPSGFAVICKAPPLFLLMRTWRLITHTRSTLLTLYGSRKFLRKL